jgi:mono/diheme cytochrome c family protein
MMKKFWIISVLTVIVAGMMSCNKVRRSPGRAYMPDMAYSRAYETYASTEALHNKGVHYNGLPVTGTIARGDMLQIYTIKNDSAGYIQSATVKNPLNVDSIDMKEAERLYLVNCGICHGTKLDGNGPLYKDGQGPYPNKPATLVGDAKYEAMAEGTMFHSVTYGLNAMGSYAAQLNTKQRWMVIAFIKSKQGKVAAATTATTTDTALVKKP